MQYHSRLRRLNQSGVHHILFPAVVFALLFGIAGSYFYLVSHAATANNLLQLGADSALCLDNKGNGGSARNPVILWSCNKSDQAQQFSLASVGNNRFLLKDAKGTCIDDTGDGVGTAGKQVKVMTYACSSTDHAQVWMWAGSGGSHELKNAYNNGCINDPGYSKTAGTQLIVYSCSPNSSNEHWYEVAAQKSGTGSGSTGSTSNPGSGGSSSSSSVHIVTTLYSDQNDPSWQKIEHAAPTVKYAIVNICAPDGSGSGCGRPADEKDPSWLPTIQALEKAGITPLYYISTNYGSVSLATVEKELANAKTWYGIANPMFDTTSTNNANYYHSLYNYAVNLGASAVMYNPGTQVPQSYMFGSKEVMQVFEGTAGQFRSASFPSWMKSYPAGEFSATLSTGSASTVGVDVTDAAKDHIGNFYEDDEKEPPNYATLPSFWTAEVNDVAHTN